MMWLCRNKINSDFFQRKINEFSENLYWNETKIVKRPDRNGPNKADSRSPWVKTTQRSGLPICDQVRDNFWRIGPSGRSRTSSRNRRCVRGPLSITLVKSTRTTFIAVLTTWAILKVFFRSSQIELASSLEARWPSLVCAMLNLAQVLTNDIIFFRLGWPKFQLG